MVDPKYIFTKEKPQLIDEWQIVPEIWDAVRHECDASHDKGKFILTGSTSLEKNEGEEQNKRRVTRSITKSKANQKTKSAGKQKTIKTDNPHKPIGINNCHPL